MKSLLAGRFVSVDAVDADLCAAGYIASRQIGTTLYLAFQLQKPVLVEGPAGVGKTELAATAARALGVPLVRLQCYEGLDESKALYEWQYGKQLLYVQILKERLAGFLDGARGVAEALARLHAHDDLFFSEAFLEPRPLYRALKEPGGCVLLVDEVDKSDEEFEAFLLELLSDYQVSVPELGTIRAQVKPLVVLTSNNTRELGDALKRRCLHLHIPFPDEKLERRILEARVPELAARLRAQLVGFVQDVRALDLKKHPSVSETIDWARVLLMLNAAELEAAFVRDTLNVLLKFEEDIGTVGERLGGLLEKARARAEMVHADAA